ACRFYQPINRVVDVLANGLDTFVGVNDHLQRGVFNASDVSRRVVGVAQVLHQCLALEDLRSRVIGKGRACRSQLRQTEGERVVIVSGPRAVAVLDQHTLTLGVVVDVGDRMQVGSVNAKQAIGLGALV